MGVGSMRGDGTRRLIRRWGEKKGRQCFGGHRDLAFDDRTGVEAER